ncbi:MAG: hypothetical protein ACYS32_02570 [Planctomycetota bacterium]|jgi:hypothetical protein
MKPLTTEFMRGRFESLCSSAQAASDVFESYLSHAPNSPDKQKDCDRLFGVLKATKKTYDDLLRSLKEAVKED